MKKRNKIIIFTIAFLLSLILNVYLIHKYPFKGRGPMSWDEVINNSWFFILSSLIFGLYVWNVLFDKKE